MNTPPMGPSEGPHSHFSGDVAWSDDLERQLCSAPLLREVLERSRDIGFLGPGPVLPHVSHATGFVRLAHREPVATWLDLGSGGGLPGLVLGVALPETVGALLDAMEKRTFFLAEAVERLGAAHRISVVRDRAEVAARREGMTEMADVVTARSFGPPALTSECAARFLKVGGRLIVSEPPESSGERWAGMELTKLGLSLEATVSWAVGTFVVIRKVLQTPDELPRQGAALSKRPLFGPR